MKQNINIEAEGNELVLKNKAGDYVIIPKKYRTEVQDMIKEGCHCCIDNLVETLPVMEDYAEDGSLYPEEPVINSDNPIKLPEVTITAEAPTYIKYKQNWEKENPFDIDKYVENRFNNPVGREAISRINEKAWRKNLRKEGLKKRQAELDEATKIGLLYQRFNPQGKDDISIADEQFQKRYGTSPHRYRYDNDPEYKKYYEQQARNATSKIDYPSTDLRRKDFVAPNNMWMYPNLTGESKKAMTDFSNEVIGMALPIPGLEAMGKIPSVFKAGKKLIKPVSKVVNKTDDVAKTLPKFESEIDWGKWNKEIPNNKSLIEEYNAIEETTKANSTWMKNPDGSAFQGTPEQFIQQQSSWFKKAFPEGFENVFRGVSNKTVVKELNPERSMFTGDFDLASNYTINKEILTPFNQFNTLDKSQFNPNVKDGMFNLAHKKSPKSIELDNFGSHWTSIDLTNPKQSISNIELNIKHLEKQLERHKEFLKSGKQNLDGSWSFPDTDVVYSNQLYKEGTKGQEKIINSYKDRLKNINNLVKNEKELEKMKSVLGNKTTTDDIAKYIEDSNLDYVKIKNIDDAGLGDVSIINHKKGNYLKSLVGNNGMFDMTNPNIYKGVIPPASLLYLQSQQQQQQQNKTKQK